MKKEFLLLAFFANFLPSSLFADTIGPIAHQPSWQWVGTISAGATWEQGGATQVFYLTPETQKAYEANKTTHALFDGEVFVGMQKIIPYTILQGQLGVAVAATSNATLTGVIWDDALPQFANYTYSYSLQHTHVALKGKILADLGYALVPWLSGSCGVGFNNAHSFSNDPIIFEAVANPNFSGHTQTAFTYTLGAGIQKALDKNWQLGVGYEFADWGKSSLGRASGQTLNSGLSLSNFYTNGILLNLTYVA